MHIKRVILVKEQSKQKIMDHLNASTCYTTEFKQKVLELLPQLHYDYDFMKIFSNLSILPAVDRIRWRFSNISSVVCNWRDAGPRPFGGDFMAANLSDYSDLFIVFMHPTDVLQSFGVHVLESYVNDNIGIAFEFDTVSFDEDNYISEEELIATIDKTIKRWEENSADK